MIMSRGSVRLQKRSEDAAGHKDKVTKNHHLVLEGLTVKPCVLVKKRVNSDAALTSTGSLVRLSPLPHLGWSPEGVGREQNYRYSQIFVQKHPALQIRMRSILLDWLIEVSEAFALHRQTFYLAQDYFDRFMLTQTNIEKSILQLIGITCLFIASKMEEACPPKLSQMAYMTADTYYEEEILQTELVILKALRWNLCPETALSWLKLYFQMASMDADSDLLEPQFPQEAYIQMTRLLDLCILSITSLDFEYRVLAASVLSHFIQQETAEKVSGLCKDAIQQCVNWMAPFTETVGWFGRSALKDFARIKKEDRHNIQTHACYMTMLDVSEKEASRQLLTPPNSTEKCNTVQ